MKKQTEKVDYNKVKEEIKSQTWKIFFKYKFIELFAIPLFVLAMWKVPSWVGWGFIKLFNIDAGNEFFCERACEINDCLPCTGIVSEFSVWGWGLIMIIVFCGFVALNWYFARENAIKKAKKEDENIDLRYGE